MFKRLLIGSALALSLVIGSILGFNVAEANRPQFSAASDISVKLHQSKEVEDAISRYRLQHGRDKLKDNRLLDKSAQARAEYLCKTNNWSHDGWFTSLTAYRETSDSYKVGENLEYGHYDTTTKNIVTVWANSPEHKRNMLDPAFKDQGIGIKYCAKYQGFTEVVIIVNHFGGRL